MTRAFPLAPLLGVAVTFAATHASAEEAEKAPDETEPPVLTGFRALDRPTGMAEAGFGWLTLPGAEVCSQAGCTAGDTSFELDAWQLYRQNLRFAFGAGILLALIPTTDAPRSDPPGIERDHSRKYLTVEGTVRYYPYVAERVEVWLGLTGGLVVVSDNFQSVGDYDDKPLIGPAGATIRTEGYTLGALAGVAYQLSDNWSVGGSLRYGSWFLPETPAQDPFLDKASLAGRNSMFSLGFNVAYRIAL